MRGRGGGRADGGMILVQCNPLTGIGALLHHSERRFFTVYFDL